MKTLKSAVLFCAFVFGFSSFGIAAEFWVDASKVEQEGFNYKIEDQGVFPDRSAPCREGWIKNKALISSDEIKKIYKDDIIQAILSAMNAELDKAKAKRPHLRLPSIEKRKEAIQARLSDDHFLLASLSAPEKGKAKLEIRRLPKSGFFDDTPDEDDDTSLPPLPLMRTKIRGFERAQAESLRRS